MNLSRSTHLMVFVALACILFGCKGGGSGGDTLDLPQYDLTGHWRIVDPVSCEAISGDVPEFMLDALASDMEMTLLDDELGARISQVGNDLQSVDIETGRRVDGTISGNQIRAAYSDQIALGGFQIDVYGEAEGTALSADLVALTDESTLTFAAEGEQVTIGLLCSYHSRRVA